jgi:hypothetical protein
VDWRPSGGLLFSVAMAVKAHNREEKLMTRWFAFALIVLGLAAVAPTTPSPAQTAGWVTLFDGKSTDQWTPIGDANWRLADGAVVADKGEGFLVSKNTYTNFQLRAEFWVSEEANSGIFIRCQDPKSITGKTAYEVNIFDQRPDPSYATGAIVGVAKSSQVIKAGGKWNTYEITAQGDHFTVTINGIKTVDNAVDATHPTGHIALQQGKGADGKIGVVKFRKVEVKAL